MLSITHLDQLRQHVRRTLCDRHSLDPKQFPMDELVLTRGGRPCGLYFCQYGPRMMQAHAVWDADKGVLAFYDSSGARFLKEQLSAGPEPPSPAAANPGRPLAA